MTALPFYLANRPKQASAVATIFDKFSGQAIASHSLANASDYETAIQAAVEATPTMASLRPYEKQAILIHIAQEIRRQRKDFAHLLCAEVGKPIKDSFTEVDRAIECFDFAAAEALRLNGDTLNLELSPRSLGYQGFTKRFPIGPVALISPFNFPLNLAVHKIAPAIASGCPFLLKPASLTPLSALLLGEILSHSALPDGAFSILPSSRKDASALIHDERLHLLSFTGSPNAGWLMKSQAGSKKVVLELGGNAACIVDAGSNIDAILPRLITGIFAQSGQSCISLQRLIVHDSLYDELKSKLIAATRQLNIGDPKLNTTVIGPLIQETEAQRLDSWVQEALSAGATLLCGGSRQGALFSPTLLENVPRHTQLYQEEAFGPVALLSRFSNFSSALDEVNDSKYGLQAGLFTPLLQHAFLAWEKLQVGSLIVGDVPTWRVDHMPYGGVKSSGLGREGIRYAIEDMTEIRQLVLKM